MDPYIDAEPNPDLYKASRDAQYRWFQYKTDLKNAMFKIGRLSGDKSISELNMHLKNGVIGLSVAAVVFLGIAIFFGWTIKAGHLRLWGVFWAVTFAGCFAGVLFGVVVENTLAIQDNDKRFNNYNIQGVWDNYPAIIKTDKIFEVDADYESTDDIRLHL
jgi:hypothetical protein